jgi:hypothetical protein
LQKVCLAQADLRMNVEWIEHDLVFARCRGDLLRRCVGEQVGPSDDEGVEAQARIERRSAEGALSRRNPWRGGVPVEVVHHQASLPVEAQRQRLARGSATSQLARPNGQIEAAHARLFVLPAGKYAIAIVRLNPALEKAGRDRQSHGLAVDAFELHSAKPT